MRKHWFSAQWSLPLQTMALRLKNNKFTNQNIDGFIVDRVREKSIEGRYIEKFSFQERIIDPFGDEVFFDRVSYQTVDFVLFEDFPNIEISNSPRSINSYISRLLEICDFDLAITNIETDLIKWTDNFKAITNEKITVDCIQINDIEIDFGIKANILVKGDKDVMAALNTVTLGKRHKIEKIQLRLPFRDKVISINLSNNTSVKIPDIALADIMPLVRISIPKTKN
jgi:hypothetical protein